MSKANAARTELIRLLHDEVEGIKRKRGGADAKHAELFRENVRIVVHTIDLACIESVFTFAREMEARYVSFLLWPLLDC